MVTEITSKLFSFGHRASCATEVSMPGQENKKIPVPGQPGIDSTSGSSPHITPSLVEENTSAHRFLDKCALFAKPSRPRRVYVEPDPFLLPDFFLVEGPPRPAKVSEQVWQSVFPLDRSRVLTLAGRNFLAGHNPDKSVVMAQLSIEHEQWQNRSLLEALTTLAPLFGKNALDLPPCAALACCCQSIYWTAKSIWPDVMSSENPLKLAFLRRRWRVPAGQCMVCAGPTGANDSFYPARDFADNAGDSVHKDCAQSMRDIGKTFSRLVVEECKGMQQCMPSPQHLESWQDNDSVDHAIYADTDLVADALAAKSICV